MQNYGDNRGSRSGTYLAYRKQWASGFFEPFSLGAFGSLGKPPHDQASRRRWIERSMHQTCRFKRINGTAYPDSIASSLRDAFGAEVARLAERLSSGPDQGSNHPKGLARVALKALAHRLRPEDSPPEKQLFRGNSGLSNVDTMA